MYEGNLELECFAFPQLPEAVLRTLMSHITPLKRGRGNEWQYDTPAYSSSSGRSLSTTGNSRDSAASATISAMAAMESRLVNLKDSEDYTHESKITADLVEMKNEILTLSEKYSKLGTMQ